MTRLLRAPLAALLMALAPMPALACEEVPDRTAESDALIAQIQGAPNLLEAQPYVSALWQVWLSAPDAETQALLDRGMARREAYDFEGAEAVLGELIALCPAYAEGWNQRAFARFLRQDFEGALSDLDTALEINPRHIGALSGKGLTLIGLGRAALAQEALRAALELNPWLPERAYLAEPPGEEL